MKFYPRLLLKCQFEIVEVGNEASAVSIANDENSFKGIIILKNETTRFMFEKLQEGISLPELIKACMDKYTDSPVEEVGPQVIAFLDQLSEKGLLVADTQHGFKVED